MGTVTRLFCDLEFEICMLYSTKLQLLTPMLPEKPELSRNIVLVQCIRSIKFIRLTRDQSSQKFQVGLAMAATIGFMHTDSQRLFHAQHRFPGAFSLPESPVYHVQPVMYVAVLCKRRCFLALVFICICAFDVFPNCRGFALRNYVRCVCMAKH